MKHITLLVFTLLALFSCEKEIKKNQTELWANGTKKKMIINTQVKGMCYQLELDSLGRIKKLDSYQDSLKNGTHIYFRTNNEVGALINFQKGIREGYVYEFYPKLNISFKGITSNGTFNGESVWFYDNGQLQSIGNRKNDKNIGIWKRYYDTGKLKFEGNYSSTPYKTGWKFYNEDGSIDSIKTK